MIRAALIAAVALVAAALVLSGSIGSEADSGADATAPGDDSSVSSSPDQVRVPDLRGLTVAEANRQLRRAGLRPERGTVLSRRPGGGPLLRRGGRASRKVTAQFPAPRSPALKKSNVALATAGGAGALKPEALEEVLWRTTSFGRGVLTLGGFGSPASGDRFCGVVDHATVAGTGQERLLRLWIVRFAVDPRARKRCAPPALARLAPGPDWNRRTVGWPTPLEKIRPGLPDASPVPFERAVLQPDRRRVLVTYWHGACDALTAARTKFGANRRRVRITLLFGRTVPAERACPAIAIGGASLIRLPRPVRPGTRFVPDRSGR